MWRTAAGSHADDFFSSLLRKRHTCGGLICSASAFNSTRGAIARYASIMHPSKQIESIAGKFDAAHVMLRGMLLFLQSLRG
jgi:hypothetical protein